ncbi:ribosome maturation factor RimP [Paenarthrobacter sp. PH39-S1]|uniref:ribosome maturation factor RimP n=1 Tax=Paenarthrobacter sp. PH39-S1 TaxID=3046204 RepID=UPI0024B87AEE|nr:ribosome maturation factor RimP [Paenarthrobacter sp. PH39-S1]MDJ0357268.1 ribosome maturation factor RimP [Paenarthrobacter sp. PH39-S1]
MTQPDRPTAHNAPHDTTLATATEAKRLFRLLNPAVKAHRLYLEDVSVHLAGAHRTVSVVVDLEQDLSGGVGLDIIAEISRELSDVLDADPHDDGRPFDLEVSSPGVSRPLTEPRHWRRARGRMVRINVMQGENLTGRLLAVDDDGVTIRPELPVKKGMKPKQGEPERISFGRIRRGTVEVEFSHADEGVSEDAGLNENFDPAAGAVDGEDS